MLSQEKLTSKLKDALNATSTLQLHSCATRVAETELTQHVSPHTMTHRYTPHHQSSCHASHTKRFLFCWGPKQCALWHRYLKTNNIKKMPTIIGIASFDISCSLLSSTTQQIQKRWFFLTSQQRLFRKWPSLIVETELEKLSYGKRKNAFTKKESLTPFTAAKSISKIMVH